MIKRFIITIVGLYVNVLERLSKQHRQPMAVAKPPSQHHHHKHTHTHTRPTIQPPLSSAPLAIQTPWNCMDRGEQGDVITAASTSIKDSWHWSAYQAPVDRETGEGERTTW